MYACSQARQREACAPSARVAIERSRHVFEAGDARVERSFGAPLDLAGRARRAAGDRHVHVRAGKVVARVGTLKAGAPLHLAGGIARRRGPEVAIDLGEATVHPFVRAADLATCGL